MNKLKKLSCYRRLIIKTLLQVSSLYVFPIFKYLSKYGKWLLGSCRLAFVASSRFFLPFIFFLTYLETSRHSAQTRFHRGSDAFDLEFEALEESSREEGECQILHELKCLLLTGPAITRMFSGLYPSSLKSSSIPGHKV